MVEAARPARILETRKTVPGLRVTDKWAVRPAASNRLDGGTCDQPSVTVTCVSGCVFLGVVRFVRLPPPNTVKVP